MDLYLKEVEINRLDLLHEYNKEFEENFERGWVNEDHFSEVLIEWKNDINDDNKVHFYPYWLMKDNHSIGLIVLKKNIKVDEMWNEYGGHISYVIIPSYRNQGYGTETLHLALEKCQELGLKNVLVTCLDTNIGSAKVIENNCGNLKDKCIDPQFNELSRRYIINIENSLNTYKKRGKIIKIF